MTLPDNASTALLQGPVGENFVLISSAWSPVGKFKIRVCSSDAMQTGIRSMHLHQPQGAGTEVSISHHVEIVNIAVR
jgi:hypothetical protein